jgi:uncharacterized RDD family membrane protein YckC
MTGVAPGWYKDPAEPTTQRYWDGEGWIGESIPADAPAPDGPPEVTSPAPPAPVTPAAAVTPAAPRTPMPVPEPPPAVSGPSASPGVPGVGGPPVSPGAGGPPQPGAPYPYPYPYPYPAYPVQIAPPAPKPHGFPVASLGARLLARLIDIAAVFGLSAVVTSWFVIQWWREMQPWFSEVLRRVGNNESTADVAQPERAGNLLLVIVLLIAALWFAYEVPTIANTGQTPGKRMMGIRVMRLESDQSLGFGRSIRRWNLFGLSTLLWTCFGIGFLIQFAVAFSPVLNWPLHLGLHDRSAATVVVQVGRPAAGTPTSTDKPARSEEEAK